MTEYTLQNKSGCHLLNGWFVCTFSNSHNLVSLCYRQKTRFRGAQGLSQCHSGIVAVLEFSPRSSHNSTPRKQGQLVRPWLCWPSFVWPGPLFSQAVLGEVGCLILSAVWVSGRLLYSRLLRLCWVLSRSMTPAFFFLLSLLTPDVTLAALVDPTAFCLL